MSECISSRGEYSSHEYKNGECTCCGHIDLDRVRTEAKQEALREAADKFQTGDWFNVIQGNAHVKIANGQAVTDWLRARADKIGTL